MLAREDVPGEKQLVAYYLDAGDAPVAPETLRSALQALLPDYMVPVSYTHLDVYKRQASPGRRCSRWRSPGTTTPRGTCGSRD